MKYPKMVPDSMCKIDIYVKLYDEGLTEEGEPVVALEEDLKCNYQDSAKTVMTSEKKLVQISGTAYFNGDIAPDLPAISSGEVTVFDVTRQIVRGMKGRNPDGTVNYTRLDVI